MKALTLTEPWATLVAIGAKKIETRSWYTDYRGPIAIHAAKGFTGDDWDYAVHTPAVREALGAEIMLSAIQSTVKDSFKATRGKVIATATLVKCIRMTEANLADVPVSELPFGSFDVGRYGWVLKDVVQLPEPIPATGALGLWDWQPPMEQAA